MTERSGEIVRYAEGWTIVTVPVYVPLQSGWVTRHCAVRVTLVNGGPHDGKLVSLDVNLILVGELTLVLRVTPVTGGAHLKESPTLPELPVPPLPEKVMVSGLLDQRLFGVVRDAKPTAA